MNMNSSTFVDKLSSTGQLVFLNVISSLVDYLNRKYLLPNSKVEILEDNELINLLRKAILDNAEDVKILLNEIPSIVWQLFPEIKDLLKGVLNCTTTQ